MDKLGRHFIRLVFCSGFFSAFGGLLPLSVQGHFVYCCQGFNVPLAAIGSLVLLYIAAFTHGRRIIAHFLSMAIYKKKHRLYAFLVRDRGYYKQACVLVLEYEQKGVAIMSKKLTDILVGSWYVGLTYIVIKFPVRTSLR